MTKNILIPIFFLNFVKFNLIKKPKKLWLFQKKSIKNFFKTENTTDFWDELSLSEQSEIKQGIEELNNGKRVSFESFMQKHR